jgi:hypothetical protein
VYIQQYIRSYRQRIKDKLKLFRRTIRTALKSPNLAVKFLNFRSACKAYNWTLAQSMMSDIALTAYNVRDSRLLREMSHAALRFLDLSLYTKWESECEVLDGNVRKTDWLGEDLSDATLWISFRETEKQGMVIGLNLTGYVNYISKQAKYTILVVESRLVPIFARTLTNVRVLAAPIEPCTTPGTRLVTANSLILRSIIGVEQKTIDSLYIPFITDKDRVAQFRSRYTINMNLPIFGIAWGASSSTKFEAPLDYWVDLVKSINAIFVVIQYRYDDFDNDLEALMNAAPNRVILDNSVDQLVNMDVFANQIASLDLVVSTSGTPAHFAGAIGIPTYTICDDLFRRACAVKSFNKIPWYPRAYLYGKNSRNWVSVFDNLKDDLTKLIDNHE